GTAGFIHLEHLLDLTGDVALLLHLFRDLGNRLTVERFVWSIGSNHGVRVVFEATLLQTIFGLTDHALARCLVSQSLLRFLEAAGSQPRRQARVERGRTGGVRILIHRHGQTARTSVAHQTKCHRTLAPQFLVADLEVGNLDRQSRLFTNLNTLANRIGDFVAFISHLRRVETAVLPRDPRQRHYLVGLCVSSGNVNQSGGESDGAVFHRLLDDALHLLEFFGCRRAVAEAHRLATDGAVRNERGEIHRQRLFFYATKKLRDVGGRCAAVSGDECSHTHAHEVLCGRQAVDRFDVGVDINKPGSEYLSPGVDGPQRGLWSKAANLRDAAILNGHIGAKPRIAAAVDDASVGDKEIVRRRGSLCVNAKFE